MRTVSTMSLLAIFVIAAAGGAAYAMPSLGGPTGIVSVPNALVAPPGELQAAVSYQAQSMYGDVDGSYWALNVLAGVSKQAELWAAYALDDLDVPSGPSETAHMWAVGGKYQFTSEPKDQAALAAGIGWQGWSDLLSASSMYSGDVNVFNAYLVATKNFTPMTAGKWEWNNNATQILGSVGLMYIKVDPDGGENESLTRPFVGVEFVGAAGTSLGLEYRWKDDTLDDKAVFSAVLSHKFSNKIEAQVGTTNAGPGGLGLSDQDIFVRVGYTFPIGGY